eukprot:TRINITY_DN332_c0_g1_i12.p1 TRINITY_DN332_c0_g1~~TRINITY_DN332_c0_g1_i12.p1  ORF type:complete len:349 (+),score=56.95 TRINITY_DN332_c0_g1_i12:311-1357(+)
MGSASSRGVAPEPLAPPPEPRPIDEQENGPAVRFQIKIFSFEELAEATQQFKDPDLVLGEGDFGKVYKGWLKDPGSMDPYPVAVKRLNPDSFQGQNEWLAEILVLGRLRHPNLVRLVGYCADQGEGLLVYEFLAKGSLDYHLFRKDMNNTEQPALSWVLRLKIALDSAQGLAFLHKNNVIHRDFKPPNILLDENYCAKLTDFGLAKQADYDQSYVTTRIMGTLGYLDPKYLETGRLSRKSDVYAFGVMLLELLSGKRASIKIGETSLAEWAQIYQQERPNISKLADPALGTLFQGNSPRQRNAQRAALKLLISARHCMDDNPDLRPIMSDMVDALKPLVQAAINDAEQ